MKIKFPPLNEATPEGLLAIGGNLNTETLLSAYHQGIYPWPIDDELPLTWFSPDPRGILLMENLHLSDSLQKFIKKTNYSVVFNKNFNLVIEKCANSPYRKQGQKTWINAKMQEAYKQLFIAGHAFCVEIYYEEHLAGGLYGVNLGYALSGESMFYEQDNGSKLALYELCKKLKQNDVKWLDTQMVTEVTESFGASYIPRDDFIKMLKKAKSDGLDIHF